MNKFLLLFTPLIISACSGKKQGNSALTEVLQQQNRNVVKPDVQIGDDIFNIDLISLYLKKAGKEVEKLGLLYFAEGMEQFHNIKNIEVAEKAFLESIKTYPTANAYYQYALLLQKKGDAENALRALNLAETTGFESTGALMFEMAKAHSMLGHSWEGLHHLELAAQAGYADVEKIRTDPALNSARNQEGFMEFLEDNYSGLDDLEAVTWNVFRSEFPAAKFPLTFGYMDTTLVNSKLSVSYDFEKYVPEMRDVEPFSRMVGKYFYYNYRIVQNPEHTTLVYTISDYVGSPGNYTYLATYNGKGRLLDKMLIAGEDVKTNTILESSFNADSTFTMLRYSAEKIENKNVYIVRYAKKKLLSKTEYYVNSRGKILPKPVNAVL